MKTRKITFGKILQYLILLIGATVAILSILVVFIGSLRPNTEFLNTGVLELPKSLDFSNYKTAFVNGQMLFGFKSTLVIFVVSMAGKSTPASTFAYAVSRFGFKLKKLILTLFMLTTLIPNIISQVATLQVISSLGLLNKIRPVILLNLGTDVISIHVFLQYLDETPISLDESAYPDGASYSGIFWHITLPNLKAPIVTMLIISGVGVYSGFYNPSSYMPDRNLKVISTVLLVPKGLYRINWLAILVGVVIIILPILIVFLSLQKYIYNGVVGSVK